MQFNKLINNILNEFRPVDGDVNTPQSVAKRFMTDVLMKYTYKVSGAGHIHCGWTTKTFYNWALEQGINAKDLQVIYFVWPEKDVVSSLKANGTLGNHYAPEGESHIAPIYKRQILDFTIGQFTGNDNEMYRITSLDQVLDNKSIYNKYGYGTNKLNDKHYIVGSYEDVVKEAQMNDPGMFAPPFKNGK